MDIFWNHTFAQGDKIDQNSILTKFVQGGKFRDPCQARRSILLRALGVHIRFRNSRAWVKLNYFYT